MKKIAITVALMVVTVLSLNARLYIDSTNREDKWTHHRHNAVNNDTDESVSHYPGFWYTPVWHSTVVSGVAIGLYSGPL